MINVMDKMWDLDRALRNKAGLSTATFIIGSFITGAGIGLLSIKPRKILYYIITHVGLTTAAAGMYYNGYADSNRDRTGISNEAIQP